MNAFAKVDKDTFYRFAASHPEQRCEFVRGRIVQQMTGGTRDHGQVGRRIARLLEVQLNSAQWTVLQDRGVETNDTIRYPDIVIEPADEPGQSLSTRRPALIVEVLSPSTTATDLDVKPTEYLSLDTLDAYLVGPPGRRRLGAAAAARGGRSDVSERIEEILSAEAKR